MEKKKRNIFFIRIKQYAGGLFLAAGIVMTVLARYREGAAQWYSTHVYPLWVGTVGRVFDLIPFSAAELLLYLFCAWFLCSLVRLVRRMKQRKEDTAEGPEEMGIRKRDLFISWAAGLFLAAGILYVLYVLNCGINYYRTSFSESSGITMETYTTEELTFVCRTLTEEVNERSGQVSRDAQGVMELADGKKGEVRERAVKAMQKLGEDYPELSGYYPKPKPLLNSWILSVQKLSGIYSPFTVEANYNSAMTDYNIPFTACHELSHLKGFMQEQEANFIAFLAGIGFTDPEFQYSSYLTGWIYCMNVLRNADPEAWRDIRESLLPEVQRDLQANSEFWAGYDGAVAKVADQVNDHYLQANGQEEGVRSYDRMVDLIVAYYRQMPDADEAPEGSQ